MALTWTKLADSEDVWGKHRASFWTAVPAAADYATGGYAVTAATFGIRRLYGVRKFAGNASANGRLWEYNTATGNIQVFNPTNTTPSVGPATEVPNATDLSAGSVLFEVIGE